MPLLMHFAIFTASTAIAMKGGPYHEAIPLQGIRIGPKEIAVEGRTIFAAVWRRWPLQKLHVRRALP